ncbi:hypothetical protein GRI40_12680 [Altererythrobacter aerius]|uniref:Uncharacterized protein n=1 Tax=Tsuneonella aeria TaxID=1837929 RepID=A0A6I4TFI3_9SPHN|nr:hypothetical protein [Tsuneonella aeria]MXO76071.1 hypothetical protein [Tsuneonella aeria]
MKVTPLFLGACAFASITGVVSGATIDTRPIQQGGIGTHGLASQTVDHPAPFTGTVQTAHLPDHYAMTTPEGRIEAGELSTRGLYAQARFGWREEFPPPGEPGPIEPEPALSVIEPAVLPVQAETETPGPDAAQPVAETQPGPRIIDVAAALAVR